MKLGWNRAKNLFFEVNKSSLSVKSILHIFGDRDRRCSLKIYTSINDSRKTKFAGVWQTFKAFRGFAACRDYRTIHPYLTRSSVLKPDVERKGELNVRGERKRYFYKRNALPAVSTKRKHTYVHTSLSWYKIN